MPNFLLSRGRHLAGYIAKLPMFKATKEDQNDHTDTRYFNHPVLLLSDEAGPDGKVQILIITSLSRRELRDVPKKIQERHLPIWPSPPHPESGIRLRHRDPRQRMRLKSNVNVSAIRTVKLSSLRPWPYPYDKDDDEDYFIGDKSFRIVVETVVERVGYLPPMRHIRAVPEFLPPTFPAQAFVPSPRPARHEGFPSETTSPRTGRLYEQFAASSCSPGPPECPAQSVLSCTALVGAAPIEASPGRQSDQETFSPKWIRARSCIRGYATRLWHRTQAVMGGRGNWSQHLPAALRSSTGLDPGHGGRTCGLGCYSVNELTQLLIMFIIAVVIGVSDFLVTVFNYLFGTSPSRMTAPPENVII